ncbi:hypothetical protein R1flu_003524 [Riccia fluitans]|uniref:Reverse transcriptase domain-containing protein n=1 Tax=Riccia fluitans TaxID=41844 RepID=A0ABD1YA84_9MARC
MQQKGFIQGRKITNSVLNFLLCQEWAEKSQQEMIFIKMDFEKSYDQVNHNYLWQVMEATGFDPKFIQLTKGLVEGSTSKLHVNGRFSQEIPIERGVKQGCPLAPLLFSLSTEPLMALMKKQEREGMLEGLHLAGSRTALYNFFADDSGVFLKASYSNFKTLQQTISIYERISGAKLNLEKSTVIPIGLSSSPQWLLLTFEGRLVVLKHIIRSIPAHLLSCMAVDPQTLKVMEQTCRHFVWGKNALGTAKIPLLAWEALQPAKSEGGLGIPSFSLQGDAQKLRQPLRLVHHPGEDWMLALEALLRWIVAKGQWAASRRCWEIEEILMAKCPSKIPGARTATGLLRICVRARTRLEILRRNFTPQGESLVEVTISIGEQQGWFTTEEAKAMNATLRKHKIKTIGQWTDWASWNNARQPLLKFEQTTVDVGLDLFPSSVPIQSLP